MSQDRREESEALVRAVREVHGWTGLPPISERVLEALCDVPRHDFVADDLQESAYADVPLPIGFGQTISQPYIVALMTSLIDPKPEDIVLDVGTGSGYQAAVLAKLVKKVYSIERIEELSLRARDRLRRLGYANVETVIGDGCLGLLAHAPYDSIVVAAAASEIPKALFDQLKPDGSLLIPVQGFGFEQSLRLIKKNATGGWEEQGIMPVSFVPLRGG